MAKVVPFTKPVNHALDAFVDDDTLLEFSQSRAVQAQPTLPKSIYTSDWSNQELADLYRAYSMVQAAQPGLECDRGISDEGDPWFIIGDDKGDVLIHICRIKGTYILDSVALEGVLKGNDFNALIKDFLSHVVGKRAQDGKSSSAPTNVVQLARGGTVCLHPAMMIAALVWTLLMKTEELTFPVTSASDQSGHKDMDLDDTVSGHDALLVTPAIATPAAFKTDVDLDEADVTDFPASLRAEQMVNLRDDKKLQIITSSQALTAVAIAAGFYINPEATDAFWKSATKASADTSASTGKSQASAADDSAIFQDHLSEALALLNSVVDLVSFGSPEDYLAESQSSGENATTLNLVDMETSVGQHIFNMASEVAKNLVDVSKGIAADVATTTMFDNFAVPLEAAESTHDQDIDINAKGQGAVVSMASIKGITNAYAFSEVDVARYDATSFKSGLGRFDGELQKYSEAFDLVISPTEGDSELSFVDDTPYLGSSLVNGYNDAAESFIEAKISDNDLEILIFENEVIFIDKAAYSGSSMAISWQLEDGNYVSMIGLSSDMAEFLVA